MTVAKTIEVTSRSTESFDDAVSSGVDKAHDTVDDIRQAWIMGQKVLVENGRVSEYQVHLKVTFIVR